MGITALHYKDSVFDTQKIFFTLHCVQLLGVEKCVRSVLLGVEHLILSRKYICTLINTTASLIAA